MERWYKVKRNNVQGPQMPYYIQQEFPLDEFYTRRVQELQESLELILGLISERNRLSKKNLGSIEQEILKTRELVLNINPFSRNYDQAFHEQIDALRLNFEREIIALEREKRQEEISRWRDIVLLKNDLLMSLKEISGLSGRMELIDKLKKRENEN